MPRTLNAYGVAAAALLVLFSCVPRSFAQGSVILKPLLGNCRNNRTARAVSVDSTPDLGGIEPTKLVSAGTPVKLFGVAEQIVLDSNCHIISQAKLPFQWGLTFQDQSGQQSNVLNTLSSKTSLTPTFLATNPGVYIVELVVQNIVYSLRIEAIQTGHGWVSIGPSGLAQADANATLNVGRVNDLAFDPNNPSLMYASTAWGGVFRSTNAGAYWVPTMDNKGLPFISTGALAVSVTGTVFAGLGDSHPGNNQFYPSGNAGALWRSDDKGATWQVAQGAKCVAPTNATVTGKVTKIFTGSRYPLQVLVSTYTGVFRSLDGGNCWQAVPGLAAGKYTDINFDPRADDVMWVGLAGQSPNAGAALVTNVWGTTPAVGSFYSPSKDSVTWVLVSRAPSNPATVYFSISATSNNAERADIVRRTEDAQGNPTTTVVAPSICKAQCGYSIAMVVHPLDENIVIVGEVHPHYSVNAGSQFVALSDNGSVHADFHSLVFQPNSLGELFAGTDGGVFHLSFGGSQYRTPTSSWDTRTAYLNINQAGTVSSSSTDPSLTALGAWDNGSEQRAAGRNWETIRGGDGYFVSYDAGPANKIYLNANALTSSDALLYPDNVSFGAPAGFQANPYVPGEFWGWRLGGKTDSGAYVWPASGGGPYCADPAPSASRNVTRVDFTSDGSYFTGADDGSIHRFTLNGWTKKSDCGTTTPLSGAELVYQEPAGGSTRVDVAVDPSEQNSIYAVLPTPASSSNRVMRIEKVHGVWVTHSLAGSLPSDLEISAAIAVDPVLKGTVYIGTLHGVWAGTPDSSGDYSWARELDVPETSVTMIEPQRGSGAYSGILRLSTFGRGEWERKVTALPCPPTICPGPIHINRCVACFLKEPTNSSRMQSTSEIMLSAPVPPRLAPVWRRDRYLRLTPSLRGKTIPSFLSRAVAADSPTGSVLSTLAYVPSATAPADLITDGLVLQFVDKAGRPAGPAVTVTFLYHWRAPGAKTLRIEASEYGAGKVSVAQAVTVVRNGAAAERLTTPAEISSLQNETVTVRWGQEGGARPTDDRQCYLNGDLVRSPEIQTLRVNHDMVLNCTRFVSEGNPEK